MWELSWGTQEDPSGTGVLRKCALPEVPSVSALSLKGRAGLELALLELLEATVM